MIPHFSCLLMKDFAVIMNRKLIVAVTGLVGIATASWWILIRRKRKNPIIVEKSHFITIMKQLSVSAFNVLFQFAQMRARVAAVTAGRHSTQSVRSLVENDSNVRNALTRAQETILSSHNVSAWDMMETEKALLSGDATSVSEIVNSIPRMFDQYVSGDFPTLPDSILEPSVDSDSELLTKSTRIFSRKASLESSSSCDPEDTDSFRNKIAHRVNASPEFRNSVFHAVLDAQNNLRNTL
jgi:hypothetical protein